MVKEGILRAARELYQSSLKKSLSKQLKLTGTSMERFLRPGAEVNIKAVPTDDISVFDIIAFWSVDKIMLHRVISKKNKGKNTVLRTIGDNNFFTDQILIREEDILGKLTYFNNPDGQEFYLDSFSSRLKSIAVFVSHRPYVVMRYCLAKLRSFFELLFRLEIPGDNKLDYFGLESYLNFSEHFDQVTSIWNRVSKEHDVRAGKISDIGLGFGFSELAFCFKRKGLSVDTIKHPLISTDNKYGFLIIDAVLTVLNAVDDRKEFFNSLLAVAQTKALIVFSAIKLRRPGLKNRIRNLKWAVYSYLSFSKVSVPEPDTEFLKNGSMLKTFRPSELVKELENSGFKVLDIMKGKHTFSILAMVHEND